jgi:NTP pyrophosphatase (non-canonical NTP hydrolase)
LSDARATVEALKRRVLEFVRERDWEQFHMPKDLAAAIAIEAAELQEIFLWKQDPMPNDVTRVREELADIFILSFSLANRLDIDVSEAVEAKLEVNASKYPREVAKGKADKYTQYS